MGGTVLQGAGWRESKDGVRKGASLMYLFGCVICNSKKSATVSHFSLLNLGNSDA